MYLEELGWNQYSQNPHVTRQSVPARVSEETRGLYRVIAEDGEFLAGISGKIRFQVEDRDDFPAVGDWVLISPRPKERRATIDAILPRRTTLSRKGAGRAAAEQVLAANIDFVFVTTSLNQELNFRRLERYLAIAWESGAQPVILLTKADLHTDPNAVSLEVESICPGVGIHAISSKSGKGLDVVRGYLRNGKTAVLIGSSGVGKSTLINALAGRSLQQINSIRISDDHGRHTTSSRQMILLPSGGIVIDTPGMRELGLWKVGSGLSQAFEDVEELSGKCKFRDCNHNGEPGCAVAAAIKEGALSSERLENYRKLQAELRFLETKTDPVQRRAVKNRAKKLCKAHKRAYRDI